MKIILTGASGFLGKVIKDTLIEHDIISIARSNADINIDLSAKIPVLPFSDMVIHAAGKAHIVPKTETEGRDFFNVNYQGTKNLLKAIEDSRLPKMFVFISTVAVYGKETGVLINENTPLSAKDPYGLSKIAAEKLISDWCKNKKVICTILRLPLIAGANPPGNLGSMIKGIRKGYYFNIAGGGAKKSIVLARDVAQIIPKIAEIGGIYNLTDKYHPSFKELSTKIASQMDKKQPINIPFFIAKIIALVGDRLGKSAPLNSNKLAKLTSNLTFDDTKASEIIGWEPTPVLEGFKII
ncbi:MAG: NAD-dependent epimerase/dehydratase family protein [Bacteroidota bacterium]